MEVTENIRIRRAKADDGYATVDLIMLSAPQVLTEIFGNGDQTVAKSYLMHAWECGQGQYGCQAHWVATHNDQPIGVVTAWHSNMPKAFGKATLASLNAFFGIDETAQVFARSAKITEQITPPAYQELIFGHLAVSPSFQGQGVGKALVNYMEEIAVHNEKRRCVLDVERQNKSAIGFYESLSYLEVQSLYPAGFRYMRMAKRLEASAKWVGVI
ncbi:GNAT family N-acetyltransferase [Alteromonas sediminis]|uniref:GNAT family N-acetyltransferase n=1 Tax=Alteromonas sediminis TaxID=2259342 RepID=A0A3N5Y0T3_9ALTE|nr:GNAT family N-acetyltransferase [Alteromonas sediminis]RPJ66513.1 GNAT family N-acetyltransferase [Alteromonas sediminis]